MAPIYVFGSQGMLGRYIYLYLKRKKQNVIGLTRQDYDLNTVAAGTLRQLFQTLKVEKDSVIINCAGIIPQSHPDSKRSYYLINTLFPIILGMISKEFQCHLIHITTDCVFSGQDGSYTEYSIHDENNDYGTSKSSGEKVEATIIRTSIIGEEINHRRSLLEWIKANRNGKINGFVNHYWNGVTCLQLAKFIYQQIIRTQYYWVGVQHVFSPNKVSKYELCQLINRIYDLNIDIVPLETEKVDKTLSTVNIPFLVPRLESQIQKLKEFQLE